MPGTGHDWPLQLWELLRSRLPETDWIVFNEGYTGTTSGRLAAELPGWLDDYRPDLVIAMLGVNDGGREGLEKGLGGKGGWWHWLRIVRLALLAGAAPSEQVLGARLSATS